MTAPTLNYWSTTQVSGQVLFPGPGPTIRQKSCSSPTEGFGTIPTSVYVV